MCSIDSVQIGPLAGKRIITSDHVTMTELLPVQIWCP